MAPTNYVYCMGWWLCICLCTSLCSLNIEFAPSWQQNCVFSKYFLYGAHYSFRIGKETSTRNMKSILNSLFFSSNKLIKIQTNKHFFAYCNGCFISDALLRQLFKYCLITDFSTILNKSLKIYSRNWAK